MREVFIDFLQHQVRTFWVESREVRVFLWRGGFPPHASELDQDPPGGLSVPISLLFLLFFFLCRTPPDLSSSPCRAVLLSLC